MSFLPKQTLYIVGNEACERFGFYGMKGILTLFIMNKLLMTEEAAIARVHLFVALVYLTPLLGAWLADKVLGRYRTILYVSLVYCLGFGILTTTDCFTSIEARKWVLYTGLFIIGLGSGGIKPCVSTFMGDQIPDQSPKIMTRAYNAFYWSINLGSLFAFITIPTVRDEYGWKWAFAVPGIFMALATFIFWLGRRQYVHIPPRREKSESGFWSILFHIIFKGGTENARRQYGESKVGDVIRVLRILSIFVFVIPFWSLFDQTASSWVIQGKSMVALNIPLPWGTTWTIGPEQFQAANPIFVMIFIPVISIFIYPYIGKFGRPLFRMGSGIGLAAVSFAIVAWLQYRLEQGETLSIAWQLIPYFVLTISEILLSTTGLEFAYTQAPKSLKSVITSFWNVTIFLGNILVAVITWLLPEQQDGGSSAVSTTGFLIYAGLTALVTVFFAISAKHYQKGAGTTH